jgi:hypothetical protein
MSQERIANEIAKAMTDGGFRVGVNRGDKHLSSRAVQAWKDSFVSGKRPGRKVPKPADVATFKGFMEHLRDGRGDKAVRPYFDEVLADLTRECRHRKEVFGNKRPQNLGTKFCGAVPAN